MKSSNPSKRWLFAGLVVAAALFGCKKYVPPDIHWKADPGEKYNIRLELESPSISRLTSVTGIAEYDVSNFQTCMATDHGVALGGYSHKPFKRVPLEVMQVDDKTFVTNAYKNPLADEDYYGLGTCKWVLRAVIITLDGISVTFNAVIRDTYVHPGEIGLRCNENSGLCSWDQNKPSQARARMSNGRAVITEE